MVVTTEAVAATSFVRTDTPLATPGQFRSGPSAIELADLDGAKGPDVLLNLCTLTSGNCTGNLGVLLNQGNGTFGAIQRFPLCQHAIDLDVGDINADGKLDALVSCFSQIHALLGDGAGGFAPAQALVNGGRESIELAEVTGSGQPEVVFTALDQNSRDYLCYASTAPNPTPNAPVCGGPEVSRLPLATIRLPDQGVRDAFLTPSPTDANSFRAVARNIADSFNSWSFVDKQAGGPSIRSIIGGDIDGDGDHDVAMGRGNSMFGTLSTQVYTDTGIDFGPVETNLDTILDPHAIELGDFDQDGKPDIALANGYGSMAIHPGAGNGTFFGHGTPVPLVGHGNPSSATVVSSDSKDVSGDGVPDVVIADQIGDVLQVLINQTPKGTAPPPPPPPVTPPPPPPPPPIRLPPVFQPSAPRPESGLKSLVSTATVAANGTVALGKVVNPPTASTTQTLTALAGGSSAKAKKKPKKPVVLATGTTKVRKGRTGVLRVKLTRAGRALLTRSSSFRARLTIKATGANGKRGTKTKTVRIKRRPRRR